MSVRRTGCSTISVGLLLSALIVLSISVGIASAQDVLTLEEDSSYVLNLNTGSKTSYTDFLQTDQFARDELEFRIYLSSSGKAPISDDYVLKLETNMENPVWKFGDDIYHSAEAIVWKGREEHESIIPKVELSGEVPKPIIGVREPGFEYDIDGIGKKDVYVKLTVGTTRDGVSLEKIIQKLVPTMEFYSTTKELQNAESVMTKNLDKARDNIGETDLENNLRELYEKGHPGWASLLSQDYEGLSGMIETPPIVLYILLSLLLGLIVGSVFVYVYVSRGGGKGVDLTQISSELNDASEDIEAKSNSINALSTSFARSEDGEKRNAARELVRIRASLNEISNEIRTLSERIRGSR
jgi:hypothetical protein